MNTKTRACPLFLCSLPTKAKVVGHTLWPQKQGFEVDLSSARTPDGKRLFTASTEGFMVTLYDSNHTKWTNMFTHYATKNNYRAALPPKLTKEEKAARPDKMDPFHDAKYTRQDGGQLELGSFSDAGMEYFNQVGQEIAKRRKVHEKEYLDFEAKFRAKIRADNKVAAEDGNDGKKKGKKGRKSGEGGGHAKKRKIIIFEDSDEE